MGDYGKDQWVLWDGSVDAIQQILDEWGVLRVFLVTGRDSYLLSGAKAFIDAVLQGRAVTQFHSVFSIPSMPDLLSGRRQFHGFKPDCFIAVGGGSVMDMAKLINFFGSGDLCPSDYLKNPEPPDCIERLPLIAVPTTAGSGSEATRFAVLYDGDKKYSVESSFLLPDVAVLNPDLVSSLSPYQTACSGFDALAQAIESFWAAGATAVSRQFSAEAIRLSLMHLESAVIHPSAESRRGMMEAAYLAGRAIGISKTTAAHALSYFLTSHYGLPHGHAVAMLLPAVFKVNAECLLSAGCGSDPMKAIFEDLCAHLDCVSADEAVGMVERLVVRIGLTKDWIVQGRIDLDEMCGLMIQNVNADRLKNNPVTLDRKALCEIVSALRT